MGVSESKSGNGFLLELGRLMEFFLYLPCNKILNSTNLKAFIEDKLNVAEMTIFVCTYHIVGKRENAEYQYFLLFPQCFQSVVKICIIAINKNAKFQVNWTRDYKTMLWTKNWTPPSPAQTPVHPHGSKPICHGPSHNIYPVFN